MSFLFWVFGLGALAIAFPFVFHLIRRQPQGLRDFSSLMFLKPTPPRITRRSRIDNWMLLLLRCLAVLLIALAFMRPFLPDTASLLQQQSVPRRVAILVDTSASMRTGNHWEQVSEQIDKVVDSFDAEDQLALYKFDQTVETLVDFPESGEAQNPSERQRIKTLAKELHPTWLPGNLAKAMTSIANQLLLTNEMDAQQTGLSQLQIVLISDLQEPADFATLQSYQWPESVKVELVALNPKPGTDATLSIVRTAGSDATHQNARLRIHNRKDSTSAAFEVRWRPAGEGIDSRYQSAAKAQPLRIQVPPGTSQTLQLPQGFSQGPGSFDLAGDDDNFGNQFFASTPSRQKMRVICLSDQQLDDPSASLMYFRHALPQSPILELETVTYSAEQSNQWQVASATTNATDDIPLLAILIDRPLSAEELTRARQFLEQGGRWIVKLSDPDSASQLASLAGAQWIEPWEPKSNDDYLLLGDLNFQHPLLQPFQQTGFNDFTRIHFWNANHLQINDNQEMQVVARFDNGWPALWQYQPAGSSGSIVAVAFDWQPEKSQLALSSKFVPMVAQWVALPPDAMSVDSNRWVGDVISLPVAGQQSWEIQPLTEGGQIQTLPVTDESGEFRFTATEPGIFQATSGQENSQTLAINVHPSESSDIRLVDQSFSALGIPLGRHLSTGQQQEQQRLKKDLELEESQKLWKFLIAAALMALVAEMFLAGRLAMLQRQTTATT